MLPRPKNIWANTAYTVLMDDKNADIVVRLLPHQDMDAIIGGLPDDLPLKAVAFVVEILMMAERDHVIASGDLIQQIIVANDFNDAVGIYAVWLGKRTEANGGVFRHDW